MNQVSFLGVAFPITLRIGGFNVDIFRFTNPIEPTRMEQGEIVNGITNKLWIERYTEAGEFTFVAPLNTNLKEKLPIGSFVSHINSDDIMIVENHELSEDQGQESKITITGRSFEK